MIDYDAVKAALEKAHTELGEICKDPRNRFRMRIPAQPDRDSDLIISDALRHADALLAEVKRLTVELDARCDVTDCEQYREWLSGQHAEADKRARQAEADRDRAREIAVALEQENARITEEMARLLSAAATAYELPPADVLAAVREEMAAERGEG